MQLFYAPHIVPPFYTLPPEESRHAVKVLRLGIGARLHLTDGRGNLFVAQVVKSDVKGCQVRVTETVKEYGKRPHRLTMAVAPTKNSDRFEWFLEKATEIGVDEIIPILCANSERRTINHARAEKVIVSAMKQSLKAYLPNLELVTPIKEILTQPFSGTKLIAHCRDTERVPLFDALSSNSDTLMLIGPEGDFTAEEIELALKNNFTPVSLGDSRMRTETAAIFATVLWRIRESNS